MSTHREREKTSRHHGQARPGGDYRTPDFPISFVAHTSTFNERRRFLNYQGRTRPGGTSHKPDDVVASEKRRFVQDRNRIKAAEKAERLARRQAAEQPDPAPARLRTVRSFIVFSTIAAATLVAMVETGASTGAGNPSREPNAFKSGDIINPISGPEINRRSEISPLKARDIRVELPDGRSVGLPYIFSDRLLARDRSLPGKPKSE